MQSKAHVCGRTWCVSVSWRVLLGHNIEFELSTALGETLLYVSGLGMSSVLGRPPFRQTWCPWELACVPRILLQLSVSISRLVISSGSRSLSCQFALGYFISSCVTLLGVGVEQRQFDNFGDTAKCGWVHWWCGRLLAAI